MLSNAKKLYQTAREHAGFKRYFKNTSWLFGGQMFRMLLGLFVSVAVARYLGPEDFGLFNYVMSIVALVGVFGQLGLRELARRELVESPERRDEIMGTCFTLNLLAGGVIYIAMLLIVASQTESSLVLGLFALLGSSLLISPLNCIELWFQSQVRSDLSVLATSISLALFAVFKVIAIVQGAGLIIFGYLFLFEALILCLLQIYFYRRHFGSILQWQMRWSTALKFLRQSWPLILSGLAVTVYMRVDQVMLGAMLGEEAVGQYSVAVRISSIFYFIPMMLATSLFPAILKAKGQGESFYMKRLQRYFDLNVALAYAIVLPLTLLAPWGVFILFGSQYSGASSVLAVHVWAGLFVFLGVARNQYIITEGYFKFALMANLIGTIFNISLNYYLIPIYSGVGAAMATLLSQFIASFLSSFMHPKIYKIGQLQLNSIFLIVRLRSVLRG